MILEEETFEAYGYYSSTLRLRSVKPIIAVCTLCGEFRIQSNHSYRSFCISCSQLLSGKNKGVKHYNFGKHLPEEQKAKISISETGKRLSEETKALIRKNGPDKYGKNNPNFGKHLTEEHKFKISEALKREKSPFYKGGKKAANARSRSKRKRQLGYTLLMPLQYGEVGHHVTNEYVIGVPIKVHCSFGGNSRKKHRTRVLQWLKTHDKKKYKMVLCVLAQQPLNDFTSLN